MPSDADIRRLTFQQRDRLIIHIDAAVDVRRDNAVKIHSTRSLMAMGLIRGEVPGPFPRRTVLTEAGRRAVCILLADYADALVRAGCLESEPLTPMAILALLKANRAKRPIPLAMAMEPAILAIKSIEN